MANVIIKSEDRNLRTNQVLKDFQKQSSTDKVTREQAEYVAEKSYELLKKGLGIR